MKDCLDHESGIVRELDRERLDRERERLDRDRKRLDRGRERLDRGRERLDHESGIGRARDRERAWFMRAGSGERGIGRAGSWHSQRRESDRERAGSWERTGSGESLDRTIVEERDRGRAGSWKSGILEASPRTRQYVIRVPHTWTATSDKRARFQWTTLARFRRLWTRTASPCPLVWSLRVPTGAGIVTKAVESSLP